jgi:hypothetical protein
VILLADANGRLGSVLTVRLTGRGLAVRVLTRDPGGGRYLAGHGVEVVTGDMCDSASVAASVRGVTVMVSTIHGFAGPAADHRPRSTGRATSISSTRPETRAQNSCWGRSSAAAPRARRRSLQVGPEGWLLPGPGPAALPYRPDALGDGQPRGHLLLPARGRQGDLQG